jgi:hypothetical protein
MRQYTERALLVTYLHNTRHEKPANAVDFLHTVDLLITKSKGVPTFHFVLDMFYLAHVLLVKDIAHSKGKVVPLL